MPKLNEWTTIEEGCVMGYVETNRVGSRCEFQICPVDEWLEMSEEEAEQVALEALWESGQIEWGY